MRFILLTLLLMSLLWGSRICAQELTPVFENITEGLPSTEVHDIFQDSVGYMWFATDRGICRYNGDEMKIIDTDKDINTNVFYKFFKQTETKVWLVTGNRRLYWFNPLESNPIFHPHPQNDVLEEMMENAQFTPNISQLVFRDDHLIILFRLIPGYIVIGDDGICSWRYSQKSIKLVDNNNPVANVNVVEQNNMYYVQLSPIQQHQKGTFLQIESTRFPIDKDDLIYFYTDLGISAQIEYNGSKYFAISNYLVKVTGSKISKIDIPSRILTILPLNNKLYVGTFDGVFEVSESLKIESNFFEGLSITKLTKSRSGEIWISTLQKGIFVSNDFSIKELTHPKNYTITDLFVSGKNVSFYDGTKKSVLFQNKKNNTFDIVNNVNYYQNFLRSMNPELPHFFHSKKKYQFLDRGGPKYQYIINNENDFDYFAFENKIYNRHEDKLQTYYKKASLYSITFAYKINNDQLILGTRNGLYFMEIETKKISSKPIKNSENRHFISFINLGETTCILSQKGIHYLNHGVLKTINISNNDENFKGIYKQNESMAWIWTDSRIYQLKIKNNVPIIVSNPIYTLKKGQSVITSVLGYQHQLWIVTKNGVFVKRTDFRLKDNKQNTLRFKLDSIQINSNKLSTTSSISITQDDDISIYFDLISSDRNESRVIEYSLDGEKWLAMNKNSLLLANLRPDSYQLIVRKADKPNKIVYVLPITVKKLFYLRGWFILLELILVIVLISVIVRFILKNRERKRDEELEKLNLELKLLTSKMNPHFTFNTINSIQYYILNSDRKEAIQYLSDFALLIRKSLEFSMTERISIEEEIHFLSLYVKLENKRFDSNFHLQFDCEPKNILHRKIPSMVIQPLVENIILHAGYSEEDDKIIQVKIIHEDGFFLIRVIDFGQGIKEENKLNKHKSYGIDILKSRVKIYNGKEYRESDVAIHSTSEGTTVTIKLKEWTLQLPPK